MSLNTQEIDPFTAKRIIAYLNQLRSAEELTEEIEDSPDSGSAGSGYAIGPDVASRILSLRNRQRARRFSSLDQLEEVEGFGQDKLNDLVFSLSSSAEEQFVKSLFNGILLDNWTVRFYDEQFEDRDAFLHIAKNESALVEWLVRRLFTATLEKNDNRITANLAGELIRNRFMETHEESYIASYAWALWFYQIDPGNWFSFDRIRLVIDTFLSSYYGISENIELRLFKGYDDRGALTSGITSSDLPVTVNHAEQRIAFWTAELFD